MRLVPGTHLASPSSIPPFSGLTLVVSLDAVTFFKQARLDTFQIAGLYWTIQSLPGAGKTLIYSIFLLENQV